jgi:tetratricopeptide (TPR) repeat protein
MYRVVRIRWIESLKNPELVAAGRALLLLGGEPKLILDEFYQRALRKDPNDRDAYLAAGDLALAKQDYELAAQQYQAGLERFGADPDLHHGLAQAHYYGNRMAMMLSLDAALAVNPRHAASLTLLAEHHIEAENRPGAMDLLKRVEDINPWHPRAWALRAVIAHLENDPNEERLCRDRALTFWLGNPEVDYLIGRKLSQHYRFAEGASYQRQALALDPKYLAAQSQLAEDLLRLGDEAEGWQLVEAVYQTDPYSITAYNLMNLRDKLGQYQTLSAEGLLVRMDAREAAVYGDRVLQLLGQARATLCRKYDMTLEKTVTVELFVDQQDFAVRTFGVPGGDGFLGVCFGNVITANSPKLERPANWEATLWHEFCHVVTLNLTRNRMPRWLSEGISVYEELQQDPHWGQHMNPQYRQIIQEGGLTPIGELSGAFLSPASSQDLQFAYYQSALVVTFLVEHFGFDTLKRLLIRLGDGAEINALIEQLTLPVAELDQQFAAFVDRRIQSLAPGMDWKLPEGDPGVDLATWLQTHPTSHWGLSMRARQLLADRNWEAAKAPLEKLIALYPEDTGADNAYMQLARVHRELNETDAEYRVLRELADRSADAADAYRRIVEIAAGRDDWQAVLAYGEKYLAVYPLLGQIHLDLGRAHEALQQEEPALEAYHRLLHLEPENPVDIHFRLASLLQDRDPARARRHLLESLADAPRFRAAHELLLQMSGPSSPEAVHAP